MLHRIPPEQLDVPHGAAMARAIEGCVHCGFCLATCPTYQVLGQEMDSPRGRIVLMKDALEGALAVADVQPFIDRCVGCLACEPSCPSGVAYRELLQPFQDATRRSQPASPLERLRRILLHETLPHPRRFRLAWTLARGLQPLIKLLPAPLQPMIRLASQIPRPVSPPQPLPALYPAQGQRRARVALLTGCVQQVLAPRINWATLRVLARNGVEVLVPAEQTCCGSLAIHDGEWSRARRLARQNLRVFPEDVEAIVTNAAGCGSGMSEYVRLFEGLPEESRARRFAEKVRDVTVFLDSLGVEPPPASRPLRVAYQDACHLAQAQGVKEAPRRLLQRIPNLSLVEITDADLCCGSAGTYNLMQPDIAEQLGRRKARHLLDSGAQAVATGNIGCLVQIQAYLRSQDAQLQVLHTVEILDQAYGDG